MYMGFDNNIRAMLSDGGQYTLMVKLYEPDNSTPISTLDSKDSIA